MNKTTDSKPTANRPETSAGSSPDSGIFAKLVGAMNALGTIWIIALMILINADILGRTAFNAPIAGVSELVSFSIVGIVFLQLAHTLRSGSLTRSDILLGYLEQRAPRIRHVLLSLFHLTGAVLLAIVALKYFPIVEKAWVHPERHFMGNPGFFTIPQWPLYVAILLGVAATSAQFALMAFKDLSNISRRGMVR